MYLKKAKIGGQEIQFPIYFPDATRAVVRSLDSGDLENAKVEGMVVNTYHLMSQPGTTVLESLGGVKKYMNWKGLIASDSGGWQLLSMIYKNKELGKITDDGVVFNRGTKGEKKKYQFTPEKSIQVQFAIKSDIVVCLDDCPAVKSSIEANELSVKRTIAWAKRCKEEHDRLIEIQKDSHRPALLAVIQGGGSVKLREECANGLLPLGFDAFGFGGWPLDEDGEVDEKIMDFTVKLMPEKLPKFALGVGNPWAIVQGFKMGYNIFDCVLPTRDARHKRLYIFRSDPETADILNDRDIHQYIYIDREKHCRNNRPISEFCDCYTCQNYSMAYLNHLFKIEDSLAWRLASIHNLRTYTRLIELLRKS